jgi:hypothetical protein
MNSNVVKGLFLTTLFGLVVLVGGAVAFAAQWEDSAALTQIETPVEAEAEDFIPPIAGFTRQMMRGQMMQGQMGAHMNQQSACEHEGWMDREAMRETMHAALADALGLTVEELEAAIAEGTSPMQLAQEAGLDLDALHEARLAAFDQALEAAVADGRLTQEEADLIRERRELMRENRQEMRQWHEENGAGMGAGMGMRMQQHHPEGGRGMRGGMMGHGMGQNRP